MRNHIKVLQFDMVTMPFVIVSKFQPNVMDPNGIYLVNIKTGTYQILVKASSEKPGFCLSFDDGTFDFHFTHTFEESISKEELHHRVCFRTDLI